MFIYENLVSFPAASQLKLAIYVTTFTMNYLSWDPKFVNVHLKLLIVLYVIAFPNGIESFTGYREGIFSSVHPVPLSTNRGPRLVEVSSEQNVMLKISVVLLDKLNKPVFKNGSVKFESAVFVRAFPLELVLRDKHLVEAHRMRRTIFIEISRPNLSHL